MTERNLKITQSSMSPAYQTLLMKVRNVLIHGQERLEAERVQIYWETGDLIYAHILKYERAERGMETVKRLAHDLGVSDTVLHRCVKFVQKYPDRRKVAAWPLFSWSHYRQLMAVGDDTKRLRFEKTAVQKRWSVQELSVRLKEERLRLAGADAREPGVNAGAGSPDTRPLAPSRGIPFTYRLVERPNLASGDSGLLVDLGFGIFHEVETRLLSAFGKDDIVESIPKQDVYKFSKSGRSSKDLFTYSAYVEKVIDGDTLKVRMDLGFGTWLRETLRLRDIDCPEAGTPKGDEARAFVRSLLKESQQITIRSSRSDKYARYLADVFVPRGDLAVPPGSEAQAREPNPATDIYLNNLLLETGRAKRWRP